jgi:DNA repair exonuclease SbcCD ATPase subunit
MEFSFDTIINILSLIGGGGLGVFFTWRYSRRKAEAEAETAEASAAKEVQDVYQQLIQDIKTDRDEQKAYISELKEDRRHLRQDRDDLRNVRMNSTRRCGSCSTRWHVTTSSSRNCALLYAPT